MPHSDRMGQMDLVLNSLNYENVSNPRFALEILLINEADGPKIHQKDCEIQEKASVNDEYTPGVFRVRKIGQKNPLVF